jgi:hypothetical protein
MIVIKFLEFTKNMHEDNQNKSVRKLIQFKTKIYIVNL